MRALVGVILALKRGECWCEMAIGNPMVRSHSRACEDARAAVEEWEKR